MKSVKVQGDVLIFCDFIQVLFTTNHHLNPLITNALLKDKGQQCRPDQTPNNVCLNSGVPLIPLSLTASLA